MFWKTDNSIYS